MTFQYTELQRAWLDDLKTTRAKQGRGYLHSHKGWCCLGRCARLMTDDVERERRGDGFLELFDQKSDRLSYEMQNELGLFSDWGEGLVGFVIDGFEYDSLAHANDDGCTFKQIAAAIEADPYNFFVHGAA